MIMMRWLDAFSMAFGGARVRYGGARIPFSSLSSSLKDDRHQKRDTKKLVPGDRGLK